MSAYTDLEQIFRRSYALKGAASILHWDNATMMPSNSSDVRAEQLAGLAEASHEIITRPHVTDLFDMAESSTTNLDHWQEANLREMKRIWRHETAVPTKLVSALTKASHESELFWRTARKENNFEEFIPYQDKVLSLVRETAQAKADALELTPYDALLDQYDPGTRSLQLDTIFDDLSAFLPDFIDRAMEKQASRSAPLSISGFFPANKQKALGRQFMERLGFDFNRGRLDESAHPFCGGTAGDVRLTTRYDETNFLSSFAGIMHETGHALYELGLPSEWYNQPVGEARGMSLHESQSLLIEMQILLSKEFLTYAAPQIRTMFDVTGPAWGPDNLHHIVTQVNPSLIRVDADEVTYPAHIILRYLLEKEMIAGKLEVRDLPEAWNAAMKKLLGITPDNVSNGCMQDIHWPDGIFGYFPTYTLGAMMAAQLFDAAKKAIPHLENQIEVGNFYDLIKWLKKNVHSVGSKLSASEILEQATGQELNVSIYKKHLETRYLA